jgi:hypothetical protein
MNDKDKIKTVENKLDGIKKKYKVILAELFLEEPPIIEAFSEEEAHAIAEKKYTQDARNWNIMVYDVKELEEDGA